MSESREQAQEEQVQEEEVQEQQYIFSSKGDPFQTENVARVAMAQKHLDPHVFKIKKLDEEDGFGKGYVIENTEHGIPPQYRGYWHVTFSDRTNPGDTPDVQLSVNGETLVALRGKKTIVPGRYLENADHGTFPHFVQRPNQPRKTLGAIKTYPYERHGQATREEFIALKEDGDKKMEESIRKHGFDYEPDDL